MAKYPDPGGRPVGDIIAEDRRDPLVDVLTDAATTLREQRDAYAALARRQRRVIVRLLAAVRRRDTKGEYA